MKKLVITYLMLTLLVSFSVPLFCQTLAEVPPNYYHENAGTIENPYQICNLANLRWLSETEEFYVTNSPELPPQMQTFTYFVQTADIDASETETWNEGRGFMPIGLSTLGGDFFPPEGPVIQTIRAFFGNYNGNNHTISGLYINYNQNDEFENLTYYGLFGYAIGSEFINIHLENIHYEVCLYTGPFIYIGSLIGLGGNTIRNCSATGDMLFTGDLSPTNASIGAIGGLVGFGLGNISYCFSRVNIADNIAYGIPININNVYGGTGGLVGMMSGTRISNCYYYGNIVRRTTGTIQQGGLVGHTWSDTSYENCFVASNGEFVNAKGIFGDMMVEVEFSYYPNDPPEILTEPVVTSSFWDVTTSGSSEPYYYLGTIYPYISLSDILDLGLSGLDTNHMKMAETYIESGWDMQAIWDISPEINNGYPHLRNTTMAPTATSPINLTAISDDNQVVLSWQIPVDNVVDEILGFMIYRNAVLLSTITSETLSYADITVVEGETYTYGVSTVYINGVSMPTYATPEPSSDTDETVVSTKSRLLGNYPNPFNPVTTISFELSTAGNVRIEIFNIRGQKIRTITDKNYSEGSHKALWNGDDDTGRSVASGIYFYQMQTDSIVSSKKMVLMK